MGIRHGGGWGSRLPVVIGPGVGFEDVAENYRRLVAGQALLHEVDRATGY